MRKNGKFLVVSIYINVKPIKQWSSTNSLTVGTSFVIAIPQITENMTEFNALLEYEMKYVIIWRLVSFELKWTKNLKGKMVCKIL